MLILIFIDIHYLQNNVFSFKKCSNSQNHSSGSHYPDKKIPLSLHPFTPFGNPTTYQILKSVLCSLHLLVILTDKFVN